MGRGDEGGRQNSTATDRDQPGSVSYVKSICSSPPRPFLFSFCHTGVLFLLPPNIPISQSIACNLQSSSPPSLPPFPPLSIRAMLARSTLSSHLRRLRRFCSVPATLGNIVTSSTRDAREVGEQNRKAVQCAQLDRKWKQQLVVNQWAQFWPLLSCGQSERDGQFQWKH